MELWSFFFNKPFKRLPLSFLSISTNSTTTSSAVTVTTAAADSFYKPNCYENRAEFQISITCWRCRLFELQRLAAFSPVSSISSENRTYFLDLSFIGQFCVPEKFSSEKQSLMFLFSGKIKREPFLGVT